MRLIVYIESVINTLHHIRYIYVHYRGIMFCRRNETGGLLNGCYKTVFGTLVNLLSKRIYCKQLKNFQVVDRETMLPSKRGESLPGVARRCKTIAK